MSNRYSEEELYKESLLMRNQFDCTKEWGMPIIKKTDVDLSNLQLLSIKNKRSNAPIFDRQKTIHFFTDDEIIEKYYNYPEKYLKILAQYKNVFTPDFSLQVGMPTPLQIFNTFRNRWCGAYWQFNGLPVIPTISWIGKESFDFCFDGIEEDSVVAISTLGVSSTKIFLEGYYEMTKRIQPKKVICIGRVFPEMGFEVIHIKFEANRRNLQWVEEEKDQVKTIRSQFVKSSSRTV